MSSGVSFSVFFLVSSYKFVRHSFVLMNQKAFRIERPDFETHHSIKFLHFSKCWVHSRPESFVKRKMHYPFKWVQLIEWSNYLNMNSCLHLSNKLKECYKFLWIRLWNICFISIKEFIFSKVAGCKPHWLELFHNYFQESC